jgi:Flp pilus assembly protein TadD
MKRHALGALLFLSLVGCGGQKPPPATGPAASNSAPTPKSSEQTAVPAPTGGGAFEGPSAPASSGEVKHAIAAIKHGDLNGARSALEVALKKNENQADAHYYMGIVLDQSGDKPGAEKSFKKALELDPNLEEAAINLSAVLVENGKHDEAIGVMKKAIAKNPTNAALHLNLGMALSGKNDVDGANKSFDEATKLDANNAQYVVTYAAHLVRAGKREDAAAKLKQAEKMAPNDAGVLLSVAVEYKNLKAFKVCVATLDKAISQKDIAELRIARGSCKLGLKDMQGALNEFKDAAAREPNNARARAAYGNALADSGKFDEAIAEWEAVIKIVPGTPAAKQSERKIEIAKKKQAAAPKK